MTAPGRRNFTIDQIRGITGMSALAPAEPARHLNVALHHLACGERQ
jgi:hypothetical protein